MYAKAELPKFMSVPPDHIFPPNHKVINGDLVAKPFLFFFLSSFILRETETARVGEEQRERERQNPKQAPHCQQGARRGA